MATTKIDFDQIETGLPTGGDVDYNNVELLLAGEGSNGSTSFLDDSKNGTSIGVNGTVSITTSVGKWGSSSINFQSGNSALTFAKNSAVTIGTEDFTMEAWIRPSSYGEGGAGEYHMPFILLGGYFHTASDSKVNYIWEYNYGDSSGSVQKFVFGSKPSGSLSYPQAISPQTTLTLNTWHHVAVTRTNNTIQMFLDGNRIHTDTSQNWSSIDMDFALSTGGAFYVGKSSGGGYFDQVTWNFRGYMNDIRITKGVARYTSDFSTPSSKFEAFRGSVGKSLVISSDENVTLQ